MPDYDPRQMLALGRLGLGMMSPQQSNPFAYPSPDQRPKQWWEQPMLMPRGRQDDKNDQSDRSAGQAGQQPMSLLDMLMKTGGSSGRPSLGPIPSMGMANMPMSMWSQLGGLFGGPAGGWGGSSGGTR